jgi:hypothetical protein
VGFLGPSRQMRCLDGNIFLRSPFQSYSSELCSQSLLNKAQEMRCVWIQLIVCREVAMSINAVEQSRDRGCSLCSEPPLWVAAPHGMCVCVCVCVDGAQLLFVRHINGPPFSGLRLTPSRADRMKRLIKVVHFYMLTENEMALKRAGINFVAANSIL